MARPLQKKKNRSSLSRVRQRSKRHPPHVKSNPLVAANWNHNLTLRQNYRNLGLTSRLKGSTGGIEKGYRQGGNREEDGLMAFKGRVKTELEVGEVKVVRDEVTGAIKHLIRDGQEKQKRRNPFNDPLNDLSSPSDEEEEDDGETEPTSIVLPTRPKPKLSGIVPALEESAKFGKRKRPRRLSKREREWVKRLVGRYGEDFAAMVRDRRLNPMQQSEGDLRRRVGVLRKEEREEGRMDQREG